MYGARAYGKAAYGTSVSIPDAPSVGTSSYATSTYGLATYGGSVVGGPQEHQPPSQPHVTLEATAEVTWTLNYQPAIVVEAAAVVTWDNERLVYHPDTLLSGHAALSVDPPIFFTDTFGFADIEYVSSATPDVETEPVPMPEHLVSKPTERVSIIMPVPESFDEFGRPQ